MNSIHGQGDQLMQPRAWLVVVGLLLPIQTLLCAWLACRNSPTSDEMAHLVAGVRILSDRDFGLYTVNPPLPKVIAALPVLMLNPKVNWRQHDPNPALRKEWNVAQDFMWSNSTHSLWIYTLARWTCIPWCWLGMIVCYIWTRELYGLRAGLGAATLWTFSPAILANGALVTPDIPAASMAVLVMYVFRTYLSKPNWATAITAGVVLGIGQLTKMTLLLLYPILASLLIVSVITSVDASRNLWRRLFQYCVCVITSLAVLNAGYLFEGTGQLLGDHKFYSESLGGVREDWNTPGNRFAGSVWGSIPVPLPKAYLTGIDLQKRDFEGHWRPMYSYMRGHQRLGGWWCYYIYCLLVKVPVGTWIIVITFLLTLRMPRSGNVACNSRESAMLWLTPLVLFVFVSSQTGFSRYFRYVLPCAPFVFIGISGVFSCRMMSSHRRWQRLAWAGLICLVFESLWVYPHSLSFFNLLAGGPSAGHWHLLDSNIDWGQDLYHLRDWMNQHPQRRPLSLAYSGVFDPRVMGIDTARPPEQTGTQTPQLAPGWYAISVNHLHGYDDPAAPFTYFLNRKPDDRAGYSILIYHVQESSP